MDNLLHTLRGIGLNEKEAKTYLSLLKLGPQTAGTVASKTESNRSSCYLTLDRLMKKGFIEKLIQEKNTTFRAVKPDFILNQLKTKQEDMESKIESMGLALKDFDQLQNAYNSKPHVVFFQDETGLQNVLEDTFTSSEPLRCYASLDELSLLLPSYMPRYYKKRVQSGLKVRCMYPATEKSFHHKMRDPFELRESRLIPVEYNFHLDIMIYDHKLVITSLKEKFGVMIQSPEIAGAQKKIFDITWESTKAYDRMITEKFKKKYRRKNNQSSSTNRPNNP